MTTIDLSEADDEEKEQAILDAKRRDTKYGATLIEEEEDDQ